MFQHVAGESGDDGEGEGGRGSECVIMTVPEGELLAVL